MDMRNFVLIFCLIHPLFSFPNLYGGVIFSELMVDPAPAVGLPEAEYIELYNRSGSKLSLYGWALCYGDKIYRFPACSIDSAGYSVLCSGEVAALFSGETPLIAFATFPTLSNTGQLIYLLDDRGKCVTCLEYSPGWHQNAFKAKGGWSLECMDVNNLSGEASNWTSSVNLKGGTPGCVNSVAAVNPDLTFPVCTRVYVPSFKQIELTFSKSLQPEALVSVLNYEISPQTTVVSSVLPAFPACRSVVLNLSDSLVKGSIYDLRLSGLIDVSGLPLKDTLISFGLPESPDSFDLSLNEVLFNPTPNGCDYVEFVNISDKCIDLSQVWLSNKSESGDLNEGVRLSEKPLPCIPGSYWLVSVSAETVSAANAFPEIPDAIDLSSFPPMPDASGNILLLTKSARVIDEMSYRESMHFPLMGLCEGVSLEKLNPELASSDPEHWVSASAASGYGTPGFLNSQYRNLSEVNVEGFYVDNKWITPDNDGQDDFFTIRYKVAESGLANLTVFDLNGRVVRNLLKNELLAAAGSVFWDGTGNDGSLVPYGRYILRTEYFTPSGRKLNKRFVLTVLF